MKVLWTFKEHNSGGFFCWYRIEELLVCGIDLCIIPITKPGEYKVHVSIGEILYVCDLVNVTEEYSTVNSSDPVNLGTSVSTINDENNGVKSSQRVHLGTSVRVLTRLQILIFCLLFWHETRISD